MPYESGTSEAITRGSVANRALKARCHLVRGPEGVVVDDRAAHAHQLDEQLVDLLIPLALRHVDEDEVDARRLAVGQHLLEQVDGVLLVHLHLGTHARLEPPVARVVRVPALRLAAGHLGVVRGGQGHRDRRVAGEGAEVEDAPRVEGPHQRGEHPALLLGQALHRVDHRHRRDQPVAQLGEDGRLGRAERQCEIASREHLEQRPEEGRGVRGRGKRGPVELGQERGVERRKILLLLGEPVRLARAEGVRTLPGLPNQQPLALLHLEAKLGHRRAAARLHGRLRLECHYRGLKAQHGRCRKGERDDGPAHRESQLPWQADR
eukprot:scaffold33395_cov62-Phaeocystis_antarctica.AAC.8